MEPHIAKSKMDTFSPVKCDQNTNERKLFTALKKANGRINFYTSFHHMDWEERCKINHDLEQVLSQKREVLSVK